MREKLCSWPTLLALLSAILVYRCHEYFLDPVLRVEDGGRVFAFFYEHREPGQLFRFKSGYLALIPNAIGFASIRLPTALAPYLLTIAPAFLALAGFAAFRAAAFARWVPSDEVRTAICLALALNPVGNFAVLCNTDYSIWSALFLLSWLVLIPLPQRTAAAIGMFVVMQILVWSHPLSIVTVPLCIFWLVRERRWAQRLLLVAMIVGHGVHAWKGIAPAAVVDEASSVAMAARPAFVAALGQHLAEVVTQATLGRAALAAISGWSAWAVVAVAATLAGTVFWGALRLAAPFPRRTYAVLAYLMVASLPLVLATRGEATIARGLDRYHYVPALFATAILGLFVWQVATRLGQRGPAVPAVVLILIGLVLNWGNDASYASPRPSDATIVRECMRTLARAETARGDWRGIFLLCEKSTGDMPIVVDTRFISPLGGRRIPLRGRPGVQLIEPAIP
jgi:hypothetical protein